MNEQEKDKTQTESQGTPQGDKPQVTPQGEDQTNPTEDDLFMDSLLKPIGEETEEQKRLKNKNAEEARKRREAEAKAKEEAEAKAKAEAEAKAKAEAEAKAKAEADEKARAEAGDVEKQNRDKLGQQLKEFKDKYPDIDLAELDKDVNFKRFINGKLLGKQNFTEIFEDYSSLRAEIQGEQTSAIQKRYQKAVASSGSSIGKGGSVDTPTDVYSEAEMAAIAAKLPTMNPKAAKEATAKLERSIKFYDKK